MVSHKLTMVTRVQNTGYSIMGKPGRSNDQTTFCDRLCTKPTENVKNSLRTSYPV